MADIRGRASASSAPYHGVASPPEPIASNAGVRSRA